MNFHDLLRWYLSEYQMRPYQLRNLLNNNGVLNVKGTIEKWIKGKSTPNEFKQRKIGKILNADSILLDNRIIFIPYTRVNTITEQVSNSLDNSSTRPNRKGGRH